VPATTTQVAATRSLAAWQIALGAALVPAAAVALIDRRGPPARAAPATIAIT